MGSESAYPRMKLLLLTIVILQLLLKTSQGKYLLVQTKGQGGKGSDYDFSKTSGNYYEYDYANTFSVGKSFGSVRQNNHEGNQHKLNVGHVGSSGRVRQNNFGGDPM